MAESMTGIKILKQAFRNPFHDIVKLKSFLYNILSKN